jgi:hypothetical protein
MDPNKPGVTVQKRQNPDKITRKKTMEADMPWVAQTDRLQTGC